MTALRRNPEHPATRSAQAALSQADMRNIFYGLMLSMFLSAVNQTIVATALPTIGEYFHDFTNLSWVIIAVIWSPRYLHRPA